MPVTGIFFLTELLQTNFLFVEEKYKTYHIFMKSQTFFAFLQLHKESDDVELR